MICTVCGREYHRKTCEYCFREQKWPDCLARKKVLQSLTPRIRVDLENLKNKESQKTKEIYTKLSQGKYKHSFYIFGSIGSGKTLLSATLLLYHCYISYIENKLADSYAFITVPRLLQKIRSSYSSTETNENDLLEYYCDVDWLIMDDLGVEKVSEWVLQSLYLIINHRYEYRKTTVFTSNLSLDTLSNKFGDERVPSRIAGMSHVIQLKDHDFRIEEEE